MNVYVYPWSTKASAGSRNPYITNFIESLEQYCRVVNRQHPTSYGLLGILPHLRRLDVLILHWAENIPDKRGAIAQIALLRGLLQAKSTLGFRLVYVLHNKVSHSTARRRQKENLVRSALEHADLVLTHAQDGVDVAVASCPSVRDRIRCHPIPFESSRPFVAGRDPFETRRYDILVWGRMAAYKGLAEFTRFLAERGLRRRYRILVAGQFQDQAAFETLSKAAPDITFDNRFIPDVELQALLAESKIVLLPYRRESVIGSSALTHSLLCDAHVIGPRAGAFRDCDDLGLISTFDDISDVADVIERALVSDRAEMVRRRKAYVAQYTWDAFGRTFSAMIGA